MKKQLGWICKTVLIAAMLFGGMSCKKKDTASPANASMSATINGNSVTFSSVTITSSNGLTIIQGTGSKYTITIVLGSMSASVFTLGAQTTNYYATISDNLGYTYSTDAANTGQITLSRVSGSSALYNGTFYFNANETSPTAGGANISVTGGSCSNI